MKQHRLGRLVRRGALAAALAAGACGGVHSGGGISGTSIVFGTIGAFGSIFVNGIEFDTTDAVITLEGDPAVEGDLRLGMVVSVRGTVDRGGTTGTADIVAMEDLVEGPVEGVNAADGTFVLLSQLVITDAATVFDGVTLATLVAGDDVEVSGFYDADGAVRASRVERKTVDVEIEIKGAVASLDAGAQTFRFGLLTIDFSGALLENLPPGGLADGIVVEVEAATPPANDVLVAIGVEALDPELLADVGDAAGVEGFITEVVSPTEIVVNVTQRVLVTPQTFFENGDAGDLVLNSHIEAEGQLDENGALVASEISFVAP